MHKRKSVLHFLCYSPRIYSGLDRFNLLLAEKLVESGLLPVYIFFDSLEDVPEIKIELEAKGAKVEMINSDNKLSVLKSLILIFFKYKPGIVHVHFENFIQISVAFLSIIFNSNYYVTFHSEISPFKINEYKKRKGILKRLLLALYYKFLNFTANNIITVSDEVKKQFLAFAMLNKNSSKVISLYMGIVINVNKMTSQEIRNKLDLPQNKILILNISAIEHLKGIDIALKAMKILKEHYKIENFIFCHIGENRSQAKANIQYFEGLKDLANALNIASNVIWLGKRNDISEILSAFDIYVHPSRREAMGFANMEAGAQSLPLVGSNVGGIPEIIFHKENGFLFESENINQLAFYLKELIQDEKLRKEMGKKSSDIVKNEFNIEKQTEKLLFIYLDRFKKHTSN